MASYGYARVSSLDQDLTIQRAALKAAGFSVVRAEKASGFRRDGRTELQVLLDFVEPGDTLVVTRIDCLARSMKDLQDIVHELKGCGWPPPWSHAERSGEGTSITQRRSARVRDHRGNRR
jgi:DNA invertase Pin-like site-specific DNA recombinase